MKKNTFYGILLLIAVTFIELYVDYKLINSKEDDWYLIPDLILLSFPTLILLIGFILYFKSRERFNWKLRLDRLVKNAGSGSLLDILFVIFTLFHFSWIADALFDLSKEPEVYGFWHPLIFMVGMFVISLLKPVSDLSYVKIAEDQRSVLLTGISNISYQRLDANAPTFNNLMPLIHLFGKYKNIHTVIVLLSDTFYQNLQKIGDNVPENDPLYAVFMTYKNKLTEYRDLQLFQRKTPSFDTLDLNQMAPILRSLIKDCIQQTYPNFPVNSLRVICSNPVNYSDFEACDREITSCMKNSKWDSKDIIVNITAGTSIVTSALTLHAIIGDRGLVYTGQDDKKSLCEYIPKLSTRPELINEFVTQNNCNNI